MLTYNVDLAELSKAFPDSATIPPLLTRFCEWLRDKCSGSVGSFDVEPEWCDLAFDGGEFHYDQFAMFIALGDGSTVGYWLRGNTDPSDAPIVLLTANDECRTLAPNLPSFIARMALGSFEDFPEAELPYNAENAPEDTPNLSEDLARFLRSETAIAEISQLADIPTKEEITGWINAEASRYRRELADHPAMAAISAILKQHHPIAFSREEPSDSFTLPSVFHGISIDIAWAGEFFAATIVSEGRNEALAEAASLKPHLAALRNLAVAKKPGLGLWHSAILMVTQREVYFAPLYQIRPNFPNGLPSAYAFKADHMLVPRETRRIPKWLAAILSS